MKCIQYVHGVATSGYKLKWLEGDGEMRDEYNQKSGKAEIVKTSIRFSACCL